MSTSTRAMRPSTEWSERVEPGEAQRHQQFAEVITNIQDRVNSKYGPGRAFHRKQIAGLRAEFDVLPNLPAHAAQGLFAEPGSYDATVRMSNGGITPTADAVPDIRGLAFSVTPVSGPAALGGAADRQDFLLINRPAFGFEDSRGFAEVVPLAARGQGALVKGLTKSHGIVQGGVEAARLVKDVSRWFTGFATETFYSAAPLACGDYAVKVRIVPHDTGWSPRAMLDWSKDINRRLASGPIVFDVQLQFYVDDEHTPIEDGRVTWSEQASPFIDVAVLTIPKQDPTSEPGRELADRIEKSAFDPWAALAAHRPLGEIMRARKAAYLPSTQHRA